MCPDFDGGRILDFAAIIVRGGRYGTEGQGRLRERWKLLDLLLAYHAAWTPALR